MRSPSSYILAAESFEKMGHATFVIVTLTGFQDCDFECDCYYSELLSL